MTSCILLLGRELFKESMIKQIPEKSTDITEATNFVTNNKVIETNSNHVFHVYLGCYDFILN